MEGVPKAMAGIYSTFYLKRTHPKSLYLSIFLNQIELLFFGN